MYVEIHKIRFKTKEYAKVWLRYYSKASGKFITEERSVKLDLKVIQLWERWTHP
jgi:hypothetical protein